VPNRDNSCSQKLEILQFTLLASNIVSKRKSRFFVIYPNRFGKPCNVEMGKIDQDENGKAIQRIKTINGPSRRIFGKRLPELLQEKLLVRIYTKDKRSKYYSITPLGIIHLIRSNKFYDGDKYPYPESNIVISILETFAQRKVKNYNSMIFEKQKFFNYDTPILEDIIKYLGIGVGYQVSHVFSNVNIIQEDWKSKYSREGLEFFITNGYFDVNKYRLSIVNFTKDLPIRVEELDKHNFNVFSRYNKDTSYHELSLDEEQFHHYMANLMLCSFIYDSITADFESSNLIYSHPSKLKKELLDVTKHDTFEGKTIPEYFLRISFLFSKHILSFSKRQFELTSTFREKINGIQFQ
jgi:hypothetical protein